MKAWLLDGDLHGTFHSDTPLVRAAWLLNGEHPPRAQSGLLPANRDGFHREGLQNNDVRKQHCTANCQQSLPCPARRPTCTLHRPACRVSRIKSPNCRTRRILEPELRIRDRESTANSKPSGSNGNHQRMSSRTASRRHKQHQAADPLQRPHVADPETRKPSSCHESPAEVLCEIMQ